MYFFSDWGTGPGTGTLNRGEILHADRLSHHHHELPGKSTGHPMTHSLAVGWEDLATKEARKTPPDTFKFISRRRGKALTRPESTTPATTAPTGIDLASQTEDSPLREDRLFQLLRLS